MTILRHIEDPSGDNTGFVQRVRHENNAGVGGIATSNYNDLKDKPLINGVILQGSLSLDDLYIQEKGDYAKADEIPTKVSELENDTGYVTEVPTKISELENDTGYVTEVPTKVSELENDKNYITEYIETDPTIPQYIKDIKEEDIVSWNAKSEFSGNYDDLNNKPEIPSIAGLATEEYVNNAISKIPSTDLTGYATLDDVDDAITEIVGSAPETLDTLAELAEGLVANRNVVEVLNDAIVDKVDRTELNEYATQEYVNEVTEQLGTIHATKEYVDDSIRKLSENEYEIMLTSTLHITKSNSFSLNAADLDALETWINWLYNKGDVTTTLKLYIAPENVRMHYNSTTTLKPYVSTDKILLGELCYSNFKSTYVNNGNFWICFSYNYGSGGTAFGGGATLFLGKIMLRVVNGDEPDTIKLNRNITTCSWVNIPLADADYRDHLIKQVVNNTVKVFEGDEDEYNALTQEERDAFLIAIVNPFIEEDEIDLDVIEDILLDETSTETELDLTDEETEETIDNIIGGE